MPGPLSSEDVPAGVSGRLSSTDYGQKSEFDRQRKALESVGSPAQPAGGGPAAPAGTPQQQGAEPAAPSPVQPSPQPWDVKPIEQRLDISNVFQRVPELQEPWRTWLRRVAAHPQAGPELRALAEAIDFQRGPQDGPPQGGGGGA